MVTLNVSKANKGYFKQANFFLITFDSVQLNLHETDLLFWYLSHHLTWHCSSISEDLHRFARNLQHLLAKLFLLLFLNNFTTETITKTILRSYAANFLQICANLQKSWNNMMSNDGLIIENMDLSHIHLAVSRLWFIKPWPLLSLKAVLQLNLIKMYRQTFLMILHSLKSPCI